MKEFPVTIPATPVPAATPVAATAPTAAPAPAAEPATGNSLVTADPWRTLRSHTPARIGLGRVGGSLPTSELLAFGSAHALARDAVHLPLDVQTLAARIEALGLATLAVRSAAPDRASYLLRPDLGRRLDRESAAALDAARATPRDDAAVRPHFDLLLVVADGLSAAAIERQAVPLLERVLAQCPAGWQLGPVVIATQARVALGDDIAQRLHAPLVAMLIGERPGLSSPDSLGVYLTHAPRVGRNDAERNCLSNVRPEGLGYADAARKLWWLAQASRRLQLSGVGLKDHSEREALAAPLTSGPLVA